MKYEFSATGCALCSKCWVDSVTSGLDITHTCRLCLAKKGSGAAVGVGEFSWSSPHTTAPLSACFFMSGGGCMQCRHVSLSGPFPNYPLCVCEHGKKCVNMTGCWVAGACPKGWNACQMLHNPPKALRYKSAQVCENQYDAGSLGSG